MRLIDILNSLERGGVLGPLYAAGVVTLTVYSQREVYNTFHALLATPRYADRPSKAVEAAAAACGVSRGTVYNALRCMDRELDATF